MLSTSGLFCPYRFTQYLKPVYYGYTMAFWDWSVGSVSWTGWRFMA